MSKTTKAEFLEAWKKWQTAEEFHRVRHQCGFYEVAERYAVAIAEEDEGEKEVENAER